MYLIVAQCSVAYHVAVEPSIASQVHRSQAPDIRYAVRHFKLHTSSSCNNSCSNVFHRSLLDIMNEDSYSTSRIMRNKTVIGRFRWFWISHWILLCVNSIENESTLFLHPGRDPCVEKVVDAIVRNRTASTILQHHARPHFVHVATVLQCINASDRCAHHHASTRARTESTVKHIDMVLLAAATSTG